MRTVSQPYQDRTIRPLGVRGAAGWRLKTYAVLYGEAGLHLPLYEDGFVVAGQKLPQPPVTDRRAGVGFVIFHQGRGVHFLLLNWWDREDELFHRGMVRGMEEDDIWVWAGEGELGGVWDIQIIAFERDAWVETVLCRPEAPDVEGYLARFLTVEPKGHAPPLGGRPH